MYLFYRAAAKMTMLPLTALGKIRAASPSCLSQLLRVAARTPGGRDTHQIKNRPGVYL